MAPTNSQPVPAPVKRAALLNTAVVAGGYLLSRVLGLVREAIYANQFGISPEMSAFRAAFTIPDLVYLVVAGGALGSAFIPVFAGFLTKEQEHEAWQLFNATFNLMCASVVGVSLLVVLFADPLVAWSIGSGFPDDLRVLTANLVRLLMVQVFLLGIVGLGKATLETFDRFTVPVIGALVYNLGIIAGALVLGPRIGVYGLAVGVIGGALLFALVQLPGLFASGWRYAPVLSLRVPGLPEVAKLLGPRLFGQAALQLNIIAIFSFATQIGPEIPAANNVGYQLMLLPYGIIALSLGTVIFPQLTRLFAANQRDEARQVAISALRMILFLGIPAAVALAALRIPIIQVLFQHGKFGADSTRLSAEGLLWYALGLPAFAASEIAVRTFYANRNTRTPVLVGVAAVVLNITLAWLGVQLGLGLAGLAAAFSIVNIVECVLLLLLLRGPLGGLKGFVGALSRIVLAASAFGAVLVALVRASGAILPFLADADMFVWQRDVVPLALWLGTSVIVSGALYGGLAVLLRLPEAAALVGRIRRLIQR